MIPRDPREAVESVEITDGELAWASRMNVPPHWLDWAHQEVVVNGYESIPVRRMVWVQKMKKEFAGRDAAEAN